MKETIVAPALVPRSQPTQRRLEREGEAFGGEAAVDISRAALCA